MSIVKDQYNILLPLKKCLTDEVVLSQAWKKSNGFIRRNNWYANILELDLTTVHLERNLKRWSKSLEDVKFKTDTVKIIKAPKNEEWEFREGESDEGLWGIKKELNEEGEEKPEITLRPLAHVAIRDQTLATAVMMCTANQIETLQGRSDELDFMKAQKKGVYSYGNRLHCKWESTIEGRDTANFAWGNALTYRQYFEDYKAYLKRPKKICKHHLALGVAKEHLHIVTLDLKSFFDSIDTKVLVSLLEKHCKKIDANFKINSRLVSRILTWEWEDWEEPLGLPQGLVASGFFANAYMLDFDEKMGDLIGKTNQPKYKILDYCRYVDDITLVIESKEESRELLSVIEEDIDLWLENFRELVGAKRSIKLNPLKSEITKFDKMSRENGLSIFMEDVQRGISITPTIDSLQKSFGSLVSLLELAMSLEPDKKQRKNKLQLSNISSPSIDVRDDTVKRFVGSRIVKTLREKRKITHLKERVNTDVFNQGVTAGDVMDHEYEMVARKLIACWSLNPSLNTLLKFGLDLYPDSKLLVPVLDAIRTKLNSKVTNSVNRKEKAVAKYVSTDLLFAASSYLGKGEKNEIPSNINLSEFREELAIFAKEILDRGDDCWYLIQSAVLYLISIGEHSFEINSLADELTLYKLLKACANYSSKISTAESLENQLAMSLVVQHIKPDPDRFISWFINWMNGIDEPDQKELYKMLFLTDSSLMFKLFNSTRKQRLKYAINLPPNTKKYFQFKKDTDVALVPKEWMNLQRIIMSQDNPFEQENALLLLLNGLLSKENYIEELAKEANVCDINIRCQDWNKIQRLSNQNLIKIEVKKEKEDDSFKFPSWVEREKKWQYALGMILRSCITGDFDYTISNHLLSNEIDRYRGIRSTSYTRQFGINNSNRGLSESPVPITPWLMELLLKLLQWPGITPGERYIKDSDLGTRLSLLRLIQRRINFQKGIFGKLSDTPSYVIPVQRSHNKLGKSLRVALVQTLYPRTTDFNEKDVLAWTPNARKIHREHLAAICNLIREKAKANVSVKESEDEGYIDLIVFPELSIHPDDMDLLESLSQATKACIFAGLTFIEDEKTGKIRNHAVWLVREEKETGREFKYFYQGKKHPTSGEAKMNVTGHRPYQLIIELTDEGMNKIRIAGAICYDATDLALVSDLRDVSDMFVVAAMNKDVQTFDNMISALQYHMYQPVLLANTGEFGGSTAQAPYSGHGNLIAHLHGNNQIGVSIFDLDATEFKSIKRRIETNPVKTHPAGFRGRDW